MKTLLATAILLSTTTAFAHDTNISTDACNVELNAGLKINKNLIEFTKNNKPLYQIIENKNLIIDGQNIALNSNQQAMITTYSTSIRAVVPEVKAIATDAMDLAIEGANLAFTELLGEGNDLGRELTTSLREIRDEVDQKFDSEKEIYIDENGEVSEDFLGEEFEQRIENIVEQTVQNSIGSLLIAVGQELLFSGGDMEAFETRMENFGEQIEHEMESRGEEIEKRGEALCHSVLKIDQLEEQLKMNITEMADFDVLSTDIKDQYKI